MKVPSQLTSFPLSSIFYDGRVETLACDIRDVLIATGDTFRQISKEELINEWKKLNPKTHITHLPLAYFDDVWPYLVSAEKAEEFSKFWKKDLSI